MERWAADASSAGEIASGARLLSELQDRLAALNREHRAWQSIDGELRMAEAALSRDYQEFSIFWPNLQASLAAVRASSTEDWAKSMAEDLANSAEASTDPARMRRLFRRLQQRAGERFFKVDHDLKELAEEISAIDEPLRKFLERINN